MRFRQVGSRYKYYGIAFAIPFLLMLTVMVARGCEPFGTNSYLYSDNYHQYYPFFLAFRRALLSGESILYSWDVGMGMDYLALIAYYLASPLNLLCVLVPESWALELFSLLMPVKLGLASLFFTLFLHKSYKSCDLTTSLFGALYGMCAWGLAYQWNIMWLDTFALLPLMALGTVQLLRDKRVVLYTWVLFLSVFSNYYIGFFVCIFVLLLFFCYEICRWKGIKRFCADFVRIGVFTVLAIGMTAILELPAFAGLQNTQSSVNTFPTEFRLNMTSDHTLLGLLGAMGKVAGNMVGGLNPSFKEGLPNLYCGMGTVILAVLMLLAKDIKLRDKLCGIALLAFFNVSFIIRQLDYIWHGMHFTNMIPYRFSFLYSFVLLVMAYRAWLRREDFRLWQVLLAGVLGSGTLALHIKHNAVSTGDWVSLVPVIYSGVFLAAYLIALCRSVPGKKPEAPGEEAEPEELMLYQDAMGEYENRLLRQREAAVLALTTIISLELIANIVNWGIRFPTTNVSNYPRGTEDTAAVIEVMEEREDGNLFYRAETTHSQTLNDGALNGYHGITTFTSSANVRVTEFIKNLGYSAKNTYNRYLFEESSPVANLFLGLKYMIERDGDVEDTDYFTNVYHSGSVYLLENAYYLPLGFLAEQELAKLEWDTGDRFAFQNSLFAAATGLEDKVWHIQENYTITGSGVKVSADIGGGYCRYDNAQGSSSVTYEYIANRNGLMCIDLNVTDRNSYTISKNGVELYSESLTLQQMVSACTVSAGDAISIKLTCKSGEEGNMTVRAAVLDASTFYEGYEILSRSRLELTDFSTTRVEGTIRCDRNGLLYTSIPQDGNWLVTVDGNPVEPALVGDAMIGVYLTEGEHALSFRYHNEAFSLGWKISGVCLALFILTLLTYKPNRKIGKFEKH